ncbi:MAG: OmpH family outer membrane protein [Micavibrio sp.]|nr:OmpH family outer membrane protein [Micavibrio sp.]
MKTVKNIIIAAGIALIAGAATPVFAAGTPADTSSPTIAYGFVDIEHILTTASASKQASDELSAKKKAIEAEFDKKGQALKAERDALIQQRAKMQPADFEKKMNDLQSRYNTTAKSFDDRRRTFDLVMKKTLDQIKSKIAEIVQNIAQEKQYAAVFTRDAVFIGANNLDITADVLARMDRDVKKINIDWSSADGKK